MAQKVGVAILGAGIFAREQHLPAVLAASTLFDLKAVYSRSEASVKLFQQDVQKINGPSSLSTYFDVNASQQAHSQGLDVLLAREDIQAVIIALPILSQPEVVLKSLKAGKHVLCEKPIAGTVQAGEKLLEEYNKLATRPIFSIAENYRYEPAMQHAANAVASGQIGKIRFFAMNWNQSVDLGNKYYETSWRKEPQHQGGFLLDGGVHFTAALRLVLGVPVQTVCAFSRLNKEMLAPIDTIHATLKLADGTTGTFGLSFASAVVYRNITIVGEKGTVVLDGITPVGYKVTVTVNNTPTETIFAAYEGVPREVVAFGNAVQSGKAEPYASALEGLIDVSLIEGMIESASKGGQPVNIPSFDKLKHT